MGTDNKKFKVGDTVRCLSSCGDAEKGKTYTVQKSEDGDLCICKGDNECTCQEEWELVKGRRGRPAKDPAVIPFQFVLQYDRDEDPIELYRTMAEVKARVAYLIENDRYVKRESFKVYEIKGLPKTITVSTSVKLSK